MHLRGRLDAPGNDHKGALYMRAMAAMAFEKVTLDRHYPDIIFLDCLALGLPHLSVVSFQAGIIIYFMFICLLCRSLYHFKTFST